MRFDTLSDWLAWQEGLHPREIDLGLERVAAVAQRLQLTKPAFTIITVGGTNGKGSTVTLLDSLYRAAGFRVGRYTSPHLLRYNERIAVNDQVASDADLCAAFAAIDAARGEVSLTYFEFGTLAALWLFARAQVEIAVLEVGLGGRLDAVNAWDADVAVVTSIDLDHQQWLGETRALIGAEKAGIFRAGRPAICGDADPPASVEQYARAVGARWLCFGRDFGFHARSPAWDWRGVDGARRIGLPWPALRGSVQLQNAAVVLQVIQLLQERHAVHAQAVRDGLLGARIQGRFQVIPGPVAVILDVAHNPHAARALATHLREHHPCEGRTQAVFGVLADKDIAGILRALRAEVAYWHVAPLTVPRGADATRLSDEMAEAGVSWTLYDNIPAALTAARSAASAPQPGRVVVCGSFYTVAAALGVLEGG